jgi:hypothetical protein
VTDANAMQVGGDHYRSRPLQHWDVLAQIFGSSPMYFVGNASKYVSRHRDKNGRQDLEKARHYCRKAQELGLYRWAFSDPEWLLIGEFVATHHEDDRKLLRRIFAQRWAEAIALLDQRLA